MSAISKLVDRLRTESKSMGKYEVDDYMATLLARSADTIEMLSEKAREPKEVVMPKKCKSCDYASKIIEAYSRGFEDGAEAVKAVKVKALHKDYNEPYVTIETEPKTERSSE